MKILKKTVTTSIREKKNMRSKSSNSELYDRMEALKHNTGFQVELSKDDYYTTQYKTKNGTKTTTSPRLYVAVNYFKKQNPNKEFTVTKVSEDLYEIFRR